MSQDTVLVLDIDAGEDFVVQLYLVDEDGAPIPIGANARMDVRDAKGALVLQFASENAGATATKAAVSITGSQGLVQLSAPKVLTRAIAPGSYRGDLFAEVAGAVAPFVSQMQKLVDAVVEIGPRQTVMEVAAS
jgi:hypothetical protein